MDLENYRSLLQTLTSGQVSDLIVEQKLTKNGTKFYYFVDTHDLNKMSFPFGLFAHEAFDQREKKPIEIITDEQISYDYLLRVLRQKLFIFDEHLAEYQYFKEKINRSRLLGLDIVDSLEKLVSHFERIYSKNTFAIDHFQTLEQISEFQISLLLSIALGTMAQGIDKLKKIEQENILQSKVTTFQTLELSPDIWEVYHSCQPGAFTDILFRNVVGKNMILEPERLRARYTDCMVFDRLLQINKKTLINKVGFLLLSSTKRSNRISQRAMENNFYQIIEKNKFVPHRSINQIYLKLILATSTSYEEDLNRIYKLLKIKEENIQSKYFDEEIANVFDKRINEVREAFENLSLIKSYSTYQTEIEKAYENKSLIKSIHIIPILEKLLKLARESNVLEQTREIKLQELIFERTYKNILRMGIEKIQYGHGQFNLCKGDDYITNQFHHLPLVFFLDEEYKEAYYEIVRFLTEVDPGKRNSRTLIHSITTSLILLFEKTEPTPWELLIRLLILTLLRTSVDREPEKLAYDTAKNFLTTDLAENDKYKIEFLYFLSWLSRRNTEYSESLEYAERGISINKNDPRFYQSRALVNYCLYMDNSSEIKYLSDAITSTNESITLFGKLDLDNLAIEKSRIALMNSAVYLNCLIFEREKKTEYLISARNHLEALKKTEPHFIRIPEFLHTEAVLIKLEIINGLTDSPTELLNTALRNIRTARSILAKKVYEDLELELHSLNDKENNII